MKSAKSKNRARSGVTFLFDLMRSTNHDTSFATLTVYRHNRIWYGGLGDEIEVCYGLHHDFYV